MNLQARTYLWYISLLRIFVGYYMLSQGIGKYKRDFPKGDWIGRQIGDIPALDLYPWYKRLLMEYVVPHHDLFGYLVMVGEIVVGLCLLVGLLTRLNASVALFMVINYLLGPGMARGGVLLAQQQLYILTLLVILLSGAGRALGVDGFLFGGGAAPRKGQRWKTAGFATAAATERYSRRFDRSIAPGHFRQSQGLWLSSIGLGTYLGNHDNETDQLYRQAIVRAIESGCNVIDSAINYRCQRSERSLGAALKELAGKGYQRDEIVVATKGGFLPYDSVPPKDARVYFEETFIKPGIANPSDIVANCHCMTPQYLLDQLDCSLRNLDVETIDIYYVHNPETQLGKISRDEFNRRLLLAFETLEGAVAAGKIRLYGAATWNGFRNEPAAKDYLSLAELVGLAVQAGGQDHHFKVIQLPVNLGMSEALSSINQPVGEKPMTLLAAAQALGITVMCSASVLQGQLARNLPPVIHDTFTGLQTDGQRALQFVRSTPGVTTALVGMKQIAHVDENMGTAKVAPASWDQYSKLFHSA